VYGVLAYTFTRSNRTRENPFALHVHTAVADHSRKE